MPRNVRNFWITLDVDGKQKRVATGPRRKDGGFDLTLYMRDKGDVVEALEIAGRADSSGGLTLSIWPRRVTTCGIRDGSIEIETTR